MTTRAVTTTASALILRSRPVADATTDTGKRLLQGQRATAFGTTFDGAWTFIDAPAGSGWANSAYLTDALTASPAPVAPPKALYTLDGEDPDLTAALEQLADAARAEGIEFTTADFGGVRSEADTIRILKYRDDDYAVYVRNLKASAPGKTPTPKEEWRAIAPFGGSYHNYGCARDLKVTKRPASFSDAEALRRLGALATAFGLRWGGTFKNRVDPPHMELAIPLADARRRYEART